MRLIKFIFAEGAQQRQKIARFHRRAVHRDLLTMLVNQRAGLIERVARIHTQLAQLEAEGQGLEGLAKAMSEIS